MKYQITFIDGTTLDIKFISSLDSLCDRLHLSRGKFAIVDEYEKQEVIINTDNIKHIKEVKEES